jgi:DNA-directed RNA polymerase subunit beta
MPWEGYNYEDAILISERLVAQDVYTSIHIEKYEIEARQTETLDQRKSPGKFPTSVKMPCETSMNAALFASVPGRSQRYPRGESHPERRIRPTPRRKTTAGNFRRKGPGMYGITPSAVPNGEKGRVVDVRVFTREQGDELPWPIWWYGFTLPKTQNPSGR